MKAISDIIAVLLMLIITIGLAGLAYSYISGVFTSRTAVTLSIDAAGCSCNTTHVTVMVRNDGTAKSGTVTVTITDPNGKSASDTISSIDPGTEQSVSIGRPSGSTGAMYYSVRATTTGSSTSGSVYCPS